MFQVLTQVWTYLGCGFFYNLFLFSKTYGLSDSVSKTVPSLTHSVLSTITSLHALTNMNEHNYYLMCSGAIGYFLSDSLHSIIEINKPGRKVLLAHHTLSILGLLSPPNYRIAWILFLSEASNIPGQITYLFIKTNKPRLLIMQWKKYQYWTFLVCRIILWPSLFLLPTDGLSYLTVCFMNLLFLPLYFMSCFWMGKLYIGYYK